MMIRQGVALALGSDEPAPGVEVTVSIPGGEELARKTLNARLGILGGLSILGTTGVVRPMSTASWRASVLQSIDVAAANSIRHIVLTTGGRTERFAERLFPDLPEMAFVQMGIFTGESLKRAVARRVPKLTICGMVGKFAKLAAGQMQTHVAGGGVDLAFLARLAREAGANEELVEAIARANTARHVEEIVARSGLSAFYRCLAEKTVQACVAKVEGSIEIEGVLFDFDGTILARVTERAGAGEERP
jgi:cobalt-precorrin-5B (C1)-methyltransferase